MTQSLVVYGNAFCGMVHAVRNALDQAGIKYEYVDIQKDDDARARVREINNGYESVPTLVFEDGSTLTEPSLTVLFEHLQSLGLQVAPMTLGTRVKITLLSPYTRIALGLLLLLGVAARTEWLIAGSIILLAISLLIGIRRS